MVEIKELHSSPVHTSVMPRVVGVPTDVDSAGSFSDLDDSSDDDKELQLAFEKGYIKPGLNVVQTVVKRKWTNNVSGLQAKLSELKKDLDWIERMDVTVARPIDDEDNAAPENDFKREVSFIKQAQEAVAEVLCMLHKLNIPTMRPDDYFAEMFKPDEHMKKVRGKLLSMQVSKEKSETMRRIKEERKFASRIQKDVALERQNDKNMLSDAVKKHKKGFKDQLQTIIDGGKSNGKKISRKRALKDQKFGHGGQKKRAKWNTAESSADYSSFSSDRFSKSKKSSKFSNKKSKKQRLGKSRRKKMNIKKKNKNK